MDYRIMGNVIKRRRNALRITQEQLAEMINKSTVYISLIESGARRPSLETLLGISMSLKLSVDSILFNKSMQSETGYIDEFAFLMAELGEDEIEFVMDVVREILRHVSGGKIVGAARNGGRSRNRRRGAGRRNGESATADAAEGYSVYHDDGFGTGFAGRLHGDGKPPGEGDGVPKVADDGTCDGTSGGDGAEAGAGADGIDADTADGGANDTTDAT